MGAFRAECSPTGRLSDWRMLRAAVHQSGSRWFVVLEIIIAERVIESLQNVSPCISAINTPSGLHRNLTAELYGQHIVIDVLTKALRAHYAAGAPTSSKPLVISLHGQSGTGKTFVAQRLVEHLYHLGMRSRFVRHYIGRSSFPTAQHLAEYQRLVAGQVRDTVRQCERALFVFDEMDKMPAGILDGMASVLGHYEHIDGVDYRRATFVFISNSHGEEIAELLRGWQLRGAGREAVRPVHFEAELKLIAYNAGGLRGSSVISEDLVDHYVPFLPLERRHVRQCVRREFGRHGKAATDALVE